MSKALPEVAEANSERWALVQGLPLMLTSEVPVTTFTVADLLRLENGSLVESQWSQGVDVPLKANGKLIGWTEFEVVGEKLAVRITELE